MDDQANTPAKTEETKAEKFKRLGNARLNNALDAIAKLESLASPNYEYTEEQVAKIIEHLVNSVNKVEARFKKPEAAAKNTAQQIL